MGRQLSLSAGEWQIMECLWEKSPRTLMEMVRELSPSTGWHKSTVVTMVGRLEAKGAVAHDGGHPAKRYSAVLKKEDAAQSETRSFLDKVYGGRLGLMMSAMVDSRALTQEDIDELTAILESAKEGD